ncbi:MAG: hypothetical protein AUJ85_10300 [Elusimicrobia bacterium CG1_02_37_114]|nr:MAG: hypothetical protein AUJ85_10300 [Elusimicrobia bacterium CG1_02_37_114]PIV53586.1 MAG: hypothetical protein COS17_03155 [Elusimicrobia bacterium CG02_land_8_20_14_3_00_37_13]PIZ12863.1 MAG: hypothetical protein COY53_07755 [Elusimicrobia bacterium CG_4_10_14_0_8_um_filter_37_32]
MKQSLKNTLFDNKRFEFMEKERIARLQALSIDKAIKSQRDLLLFCETFKKNFIKDSPVCYKILLKNK